MPIIYMYTNMHRINWIYILHIFFMVLVDSKTLKYVFYRYVGHGMKLDNAIQGCLSKQPVILLAHQPHAAKKALASDYKIDVILSGIPNLENRI